VNLEIVVSLGRTRSCPARWSTGNLKVSAGRDRHARAAEGCCENAFIAQTGEDFCGGALEPIEAEPITSLGKG